MGFARLLLVTADDYGIGPETSRGILDLAKTGKISATALIVNTADSQFAVAAWRKAGRPLELGWHPNLTLDRPLLPPNRIPSLVDSRGQFWNLGRFLLRAQLGRIRHEDVVAELTAQCERYGELVGALPRLVNSHQHVAAFGPVGAALLEVLDQKKARPFIRRIGEPAATLWRVPGARCKRLILSWHGRSLARLCRERGYPGCDVMIGITNPSNVFDDSYFARWLDTTPGERVELMCHPGHEDATLIGRDCPAGIGIQRRVREMELMQRPDFLASLRLAGFRVATIDDFVPGASRLAA